MAVTLRDRFMNARYILLIGIVLSLLFPAFIPSRSSNSDFPTQPQTRVLAQALGLGISGPQEGVVGNTYSFTANVAPATAILPITYVWQVTDRAFDADLENDDGGFQASGASRTWEWGEPASGPGSAHSGHKVWATNLDGNAGYNEYSYLTSPEIDLSDFTNQSLVLDWWEWLQPYSWGDTYYGELHVRGGTTDWTTLYRGIGNSDPSWTNQEVDITQFGGVGDFQFRFHLAGRNDFPGWYVDDITIRPAIGSVGAQPPITHTGGLSDTASFQWRNPGTKMIQVVASTGAEVMTSTETIKIYTPISNVAIDGPTIGMAGVDQILSVSVSPITATWPVTYVWEATGYPTLITTTNELHNTVVLNWSDVGTKFVTVTAINTVNVAQGVHEIEVKDPTRVEESIASNTTWTVADSPYLVTENILVYEHATLTIEPGVLVWFEDTYGLQVMGTLIARGTSDRPIVFSSPKGQKNKNDWWGIGFEEMATGAIFDAEGNYSSGSALQYVIVEYAGYRRDSYEDYYAVSAPSTALYVDHSTIRHNGCGGLQVGGDGSYLTNNTVWDNAGIGIMVESNNNTTGIANNTIMGNNGSGISIDDNASGNPITIRDNTISGNAAPINGGGIYARGDAILIDSNTINGNYAYAAGGGIYASGSIAISGNTVGDNIAAVTYEYNGGGGIYARGSLSSSVTVDNNVIYGNTTGGTGGGIFSRGNNDVTHNLILSNTAKAGLAGGIYSQDVSDAYEHPMLHHNALQGNSGYALYNGNDFEDFARLDARYNWWGTDDDQTIEEAIYDFRDDYVKGLVVYTPYLFDPPNLEPSVGNLSGRSSGQMNVNYSFEFSVFPLAAVTPITYVWRATDQAPLTKTTDILYDQVDFAWDTTGTKSITVTASNQKGTTGVTHTVDIVASSDSDEYEADDICTQATLIATAGVAQLHNFHMAEDEDWVFFQATAGTTYIIEATTPEDSDADVNLEVYGDCSSKPVDGQDPVFSPDISLTFTAPEDGILYVRLANTGSIADARGANYYLSVRALNQTPSLGALILVTGKMKDDDPLQSNMYNVTDAVYRLFLAHGYTGDRIYYLAPDAERDIDEDGTNDVDAVSSRASLEYAITGWAQGILTADQPLTLYLMDHGGYDVFYLNYVKSATSLSVETITPLDLNNWLDELEAVKTGGKGEKRGTTESMKMNVIIEACHSGSFINESPQKISKPGRVVVASTGAYPIAYASQTGAVFSDAFVAALERGMSLYSSFMEAKRGLQEAYPSQTPWLDDDGDGIPNGTDDGLIAAQRGFAFAGTFSSGVKWPPYIAQATFSSLDRTIEAQVQIQPGKVVSDVRAWIYPPSYQPPLPGEDMVQDNVEKVALEDPDGDSIFTASYDFSRELGLYRVVIYAIDTDGLSARPREATGSRPGFWGFSSRIYLPLVIR